MHKIYSHSFVARMADENLSRNVARGTAVVANRPWLRGLVKKVTNVDVIDVEREIDTYKQFAAVKAELVERERLSSSQRFALSNDGRYASADDLYLVTMVSVPDRVSGKSLQREFLFDQVAYAKLGIRAPTSSQPVGTVGSVLGTTVYDIGTKGQKAFAMVPRVHTVEPAETGRTQDVEAALNGPKSPSKRMKLGFMNPKPKNPS